MNALSEKPNEIPSHHLPVTLHMETGSIGEIGNSWYTFLRNVLRASDIIDARRAARQCSYADVDAMTIT